MHQAAIVFPTVPTTDFISMIQFLMHSQIDWCFLSVYVWTYWGKKKKKKRNQHFKSQDAILITLFGLNIYIF